MSLRHFGIAALFLLVVGLATQIPIPGMKMVPVQPLPAVPTSQNESIEPAPPGTPVTGIRTFQQVTEDRETLERAAAYNAIPIDPKRHAMLQEVVDAAQQVTAFPCSAHNRHRLAEAVAVMGNFNRDQVGKPETATMMVNGHPVAVGDPLAGQANDILWAALAAGVVGRTPTGYMTVPDPYAPVDATDHAGGRGAKFFCDKPN
jgi:hypothetical protein